jgi:endonuclease-8
MPEGDTIHKLAAYLHPRLAGSRLVSGRLRDHPRVRLEGRRVERVFARGKHLFVALDDGMLLRSHLGMYGSWHRYARGERWRRPANRASIQLDLDDVTFVCFNAKEVELVREAGVRDRHLQARLGPDLLAPTVELDDILARARDFLAPAAPLADLLLDQRVAAGIGNVYKSEILYLEGQHPSQRVAGLTNETIRALYARARTLLEKNVGGGPRITRFVDDGRGRHWVYGRHRLPCLRCGDRIDYARLGRGWRSTFWCPRCQPL